MGRKTQQQEANIQHVAKITPRLISGLNKQNPEFSQHVFLSEIYKNYIMYYGLGYARFISNTLQFMWTQHARMSKFYSFAIFSTEMQQ